MYDPTDAVGRLLFNVLAMVAEFEAHGHLARSFRQSETTPGPVSRMPHPCATPATGRSAHFTLHPERFSNRHAKCSPLTPLGARITWAPEGGTVARWSDAEGGAHVLA